MNGRFPSILLYKYPRMSPKDVDIWKRFLMEHQDMFNSFDYDFPVGSGEDPGPKFEPNLRKDFIDLTKKRIDVVGYKNGEPTIIEIKPRASSTALGQLLTYKTLFIDSHPSFQTVPLMVITEFINTEDRTIFDSNNIQIFVV